MIARLLEIQPDLLSFIKPVLLYLITTGKIDIVYKVCDLIHDKGVRKKVKKEASTLMFKVFHRPGTLVIVSTTETN